MSTLNPVDINLHSVFNDFYVYEWVIRGTGEVFYVGKGRGNRAQEYHYNNEDAERIRATYETDIVIIKDGLLEEEALILESQEIVRIKNETPWILTNVSTPQGVSNAWSPSKSTPMYSFETAPMIYASDVEEHYYGLEGRKYDSVNISELQSVFINERMVQPEIKEIIFGGQYERYFEQTVQLLKMHGVRVLSSQYAKSVSAWVYCGNLSLWLYENEQTKAEERIGHRVPAVHLVDVWKVLQNHYNQPISIDKEIIEINPVNNRTPLKAIPQFGEDMDSINLGRNMLKKGFVFYHQGKYETAIEYFDKARSKGCIDPSMFHYYAVMYRKLKDYDNEIDILNEAIMRYQTYSQDIYGGHILEFKKRREKAIALLNRQLVKK